MITKKEYFVLAKHLFADILLHEGGTFEKEVKAGKRKGDFVFDSAEAKRVHKILEKLANAVETPKKNDASKGARNTNRVAGILGYARTPERHK